MRWGLVGSLILLGSAGCGGSANRPVTGSVTLDGQPLPWGQLYLRGSVDKAGKTSHGVYEVREGRIIVSGEGLPPGDYSVTLLVHEGSAPPPPATPAAEASGPEPNVKGQWEGTVQIQAGTPLSLEVDSSQLQPPAGTAPQRTAPGV